MTSKLKQEATTLASANKTLTPPESQALTQYELTIRKGRDTFVEVGNALVEIRDQRLYRGTHDTFEDYCCDKWKFTARQANRLIGAGSVVDNLKRDQLASSEPVAVPENAAQARPLAALSPAQQTEAARKVAAKTAEPTAKDFEEAADEVTGKKPKKNNPRPKTAEDEEEDEARVQSYDTRVENGSAKEALEKLMEMVDAAQTQARKIKNGADLVKMLGEAANLISRKLNGGGL